MALFKLNLPNDYNSESRMADAVAQCYEGDREGAEADGCRELFEVLAAAAKEAGLSYAGETDYGSEWEGTEEQFVACVAALPGWAQRYVSKVEEEEE